MHAVLALQASHLPSPGAWFLPPHPKPFTPWLELKQAEGRVLGRLDSR